jgi:hypothetical protein
MSTARHHQHAKQPQIRFQALGLLLTGLTSLGACNQAPGPDAEGMQFTAQTPAHTAGTLRRGDQTVSFDLQRTGTREALAITRGDGTPLVRYELDDQLAVTRIFGDQLAVEAPRALAVSRTSQPDFPALARQTRVTGDPRSWELLRQRPEYPLVSEVERQLGRGWEPPINYAGCSWWDRIVCSGAIAPCSVWCSDQPPHCMGQCLSLHGMGWCTKCL